MTVASIALAVAGIVVIAVADGTARAIGCGLVALAGTLAMCLIFLEGRPVGRSPRLGCSGRPNRRRVGATMVLNY